MKKDEKDKEAELSDVIGGTLNIFGLKIDLAQLLSSAENMRDQLGELREKLKKAGGKEVLSDEEWRQGEASISGHFKTSGILGEREFHIGTAGPSARHKGGTEGPEAPEVAEPPVDVFYEDPEVVVIAEVPGVGLADLEIKVGDSALSLSTNPGARRSYRKEIKLAYPVAADSWKASCRNGILEVHLKKSTA